MARSIFFHPRRFSNASQGNADLPLRISNPHLRQEPGATDMKISLLSSFGTSGRRFLEPVCKSSFWWPGVDLRQEAVGKEFTSVESVKAVLVVHHARAKPY